MLYKVHFNLWYLDSLNYRIKHRTYSSWMEKNQLGTQLSVKKKSVSSRLFYFITLITLYHNVRGITYIHSDSLRDNNVSGYSSVLLGFKNCMKYKIIKYFI